MGILGTPDFYTVSFEFDMNEFYVTSLCFNCLYHGIDWLYTSYQTIYSYDFRVWYLSNLNSIFDESFNFFFFSYWYFSLSISSFQLIWSFLLDTIINNSIVKFHFTDDWFRSLLSSKEFTLVLIYHPELSLIQNQINDYFYINFFTNIIFSVFEYIESENFLTPVMFIPQFMFLLFITLIFINTYFSYFSSLSKEGNIIDADYLNSTSAAESEKEISSYDDIILAFVILFFIFGWYFYIHCWSIISCMPELILVFYLLPGLYCIIIGIPTFLAYDFGIFFLAYLKGIGASPVLLFELMYDYIQLLIFYTRILVQGVRLILMLFTYASMHDLVVLFSYDQKMFLGSESFWEELNEVSFTLDSMSYYILLTLPTRLMYWIYEILHTFFVVTVQFFAFFAVVFWLFLFLYTFFVSEKHEDYFSEKRLERKLFFSYLTKFKSNS